MSSSWNMSLRISPESVLLVGAEHLEACLLQRGPDVLGVGAIEVDAFLRAVRHDDERVEGHGSPPQPRRSRACVIHQRVSCRVPGLRRPYAERPYRSRGKPTKQWPAGAWPMLQPDEEPVKRHADGKGLQRPDLRNGRMAGPLGSRLDGEWLLSRDGEAVRGQPDIHLAGRL